MNVPHVLVISGVSGAGKSTLGEALKEFLLERGHRVTLLDGDTLRDFFDGSFQYSSRDRLIVSKILAYAAHLLSEQGVDVILATMLSQKGAREFLYSKVKCVEIFLDVPVEYCAAEDVKEVYSTNLAQKNPNVVGYDLDFQTPESPDLIIKPYTETPEESVKRIVKFLSEKGVFGL